MTVRILQGDCRQVLKTLPDASVDAVVTDPPYELGFMGRGWDKTGVAFDAAVWTEALRVLKPGGHLLAFGGTRMFHRLACAIEDAGFQLRDTVVRMHDGGDVVMQAEDCPWLGLWSFGSGFPKSLNLGGDWQGWGTALKPAYEPIVMARKPLGGTVAENVLQHGTGALNIDGCRVDGGERPWREARRNEQSDAERSAYGKGLAGSKAVEPTTAGRWPANLIHDGSDAVMAVFPDAPGQQRSVGPEHGPKPGVNAFGDFGPRDTFKPRGDSGSAARFFWSPKASRSDRNDGLHDLPDRLFGMSSAAAAAAAAAAARGEHYDNGDGGVNRVTKRKNHHLTVKPTDLMRYLCRLVTPPGGTVLDPFAGSGSTLKAAELEGFSAIGIELSAEYIEIARRRVASDAPLFAEVTTGAAAVTDSLPVPLVAEG